MYLSKKQQHCLMIVLVVVGSIALLIVGLTLHSKQGFSTDALALTKNSSRGANQMLSQTYESKNSAQFIEYLEEPFTILRTALETNPTLRKLVTSTMQASPVSVGKDLTQFINFFKTWQTAKIRVKDPGDQIAAFMALTSTPESVPLMKYGPWLLWLLVFFETRHEYLSSPATHAWIPFMATDTAGGKGFDMQMTPATQAGAAGPSQETRYQKTSIKKYDLLNKLVTRDGTRTLDLPKADMIKLFNFNSFNDFFLRRFLPGTRPIGAAPAWHKGAPRQPNAIVSPADGKIKWVFREDGGDHLQQKFMIKSKHYSMHEIFSICNLEKKGQCVANEYWNRLKNGPVIDVLLWFTDYHRFHSVASGKIISIQEYGLPSLLGPLYGQGPADPSTAPKSAQWTNDIAKHRRAVYVLDTDVKNGTQIGIVLMIPIGFFGVGSIVTKIKEGMMVEKGQEMGNFAYGGSSFVVCFEPNKVKIDIPYKPAPPPFPAGSSAFQPIQVRQAIGTRL